MNPASRGGRGAADWPAAAVALRSHFGPFEFRFTSGPGDASRIAREEALRGRTLVVAFGGDGTISETARGILESGRPAELGILPHGTGGDLVRSLALPTRAADAARALRRGRSVEIDVGRVVFADGGEKSFVNSASFGLSAEVARRVGDDRARGYVAETLRAASSYDCPEVELRLDSGSRRRVRITTVSLHNGRYFGGGMNMAPEAELADGLLDLVVVRKLSFTKLVRESPRLYLGTHLGLPEVEHGRVRSLDARAVDSAREVPVEIDGEAGGVLPARFEIRPRAIRLRV
ncbi:MAG TPA: diacylglycerol kinase family protein [Vicinamibacteria bacterium]|nr:diacylglycerol kinase family protein [Vicinamibacteria bacterium]